VVVFFCQRDDLFSASIESDKSAALSLTLAALIFVEDVLVLLVEDDEESLELSVLL
jgi:hypothetical protein